MSPVAAILIHEDHVEQIELDIDPRKNEIFTILGGRATFVGQWPDAEVVIMRREWGEGRVNEHRLPYPFHEETIIGKILLIRMDKNAEPQDFTMAEWARMLSP